MADYGRCDPVGAEEIAAWGLFEKRLGAYLSTMVDPSEEDRLVLHVPHPRAEAMTWRIVIRTVQEGSLLEIGYGFDEVHCEPDDLGEMPWRIGDTIRARASLMHPELISVSASGPASIGLAILGLAEHDAIVEGVVDVDEIETVTDGQEDLFFADGHDDLVSLVLAHVRARYDADTDLDADGDIPIRRGGACAWVTVCKEAPATLLHTVVVDSVRSRRQADVELNVLNRQHVWSRWVRHERCILQRAIIPAWPFNPGVFDELVDDFFNRHHAVTTDLSDRLSAVEF